MRCTPIQEAVILSKELYSHLGRCTPIQDAAIWPNKLYTYLDYVLLVRDTAQENVMNAHEKTLLFLVVVNQPKNITAISTRQPII